jgi:hypothetical protein
MLQRIKSFFSGMFRDYDEPIPVPLRNANFDGMGEPHSLVRVYPRGPVNAPTGPAKDYAEDPKEDSLRQAFITPKPRKYIWWDKKRHAWRVRVKGKHLGYFKTLSVAVRVRNSYCKGVGIKVGRGE